MESNNLDINIGQLQQVQLEILIEFDKICKRNNIQYQLFSGTLLGAVRHSGFIPWDDDIDVCILRTDYNKFLNICKVNLDNKYFLQNYETDKGFIHSFTRIRKNNTLLIQKAWAELDINHGIFIDVFPMDNILPDKFVGKLQYYLIYGLRRFKFFKVKNVCLNSTNHIKTYVKLFFYILLKPFSIQWLNKLETKITTMFEKRNTMYSTLLTDGGKDVYLKCMVRNNEFYNTIDMDFEGYKFPIPINYDKVLRNLWGLHDATTYRRTDTTSWYNSY